MRLTFLLIFLSSVLATAAQSLPDFGGLVRAVLGTGGTADEEEQVFDPDVDIEVLGATLDYIDQAARINNAASAAEMVSPERRASWLGSLRLPGMAAEALSRDFFRPVPGVVTSPYGYRARFRWRGKVGRKRSSRLWTLCSGSAPNGSGDALRSSVSCSGSRR